MVMSAPMRIGYLILAPSTLLLGACQTSLRILHTKSYNATVGEETINDTREKLNHKVILLVLLLSNEVDTI